MPRKGSIDKYEKTALRLIYAPLSTLCAFLFLIFLLLWLDKFHNDGHKDAILEKLNFNKNYALWMKNKKTTDPFFSRIYIPNNKVEYGIVISANQTFISIYTISGRKTYPANSVKIEQVTNT